MRSTNRTAPASTCPGCARLQLRITALEETNQGQRAALEGYRELVAQLLARPEPGNGDGPPLPVRLGPGPLHERRAELLACIGDVPRAPRYLGEQGDELKGDLKALLRLGLIERVPPAAGTRYGGYCLTGLGRRWQEEML